MIGYYNYTVILTYLSLASSVTGICLAMSGHPLGAIWALLFSGLCDMFDGRVARMKKDRTVNECKFGIQIDSLCDVIAFGVLPAAIGYSVGMTRIYLLPILILFVLCAVIRLAYFNVTEEERQITDSGKRLFYEGLPVTSSAVIIPFAYCMKAISDKILLPIFAITMLTVAILYVSPIKVPKPGKYISALLLALGMAEFICLLVLSF